MDTSTQENYDAIIIGAGPAGMMAAITAAGRGRRVLLLEKMPSAGMKLLISGKGRCNLTNAGSIDKFLKKFSVSGAFLRNAFAQFFNDELCAFFEAAGCRLKVERGERVFPESDKAQDVLNVLLKKIKEYGVTVRYNEEVTDILPGAVITKGGMKFHAENILIATGGLSYPATGSTGFGLRLAKRLRHTVVAPRPALVALISPSGMCRRLAGISLENVAANGRLGDVLFTYSGLSGPIILDMSADIYDLIKAGHKASISINLKPGLDEKKLDARLKREFMSAPSKALKNILKELLPQRLVDEFVKYCGIEGHKKANQITAEERKRLINCLFDFRIDISGTMPVKSAIVTRGGVSTNQINPKTMESRIVKGIYFAGEVIDVDAKTGGYNMQAAFSTGYAAGMNI